jgi:5-methylthioadenosine/S-adenosylhomocysteine deaminase
LAPGLKADLVVFDLDQPHLTPLYEPYSHLVYAAVGSDIQTVVVHGRVLVQDRKILSFDLEETMTRARELARSLGSCEIRKCSN